MVGGWHAPHVGGRGFPATFTLGVPRCIGTAGVAQGALRRLQSERLQPRRSPPSCGSSRLGTAVGCLQGTAVRARGGRCSQTHGAQCRRQQPAYRLRVRFPGCVTQQSPRAANDPELQACNGGLQLSMGHWRFLSWALGAPHVPPRHSPPAAVLPEARLMPASVKQRLMLALCFSFIQPITSSSVHVSAVLLAGFGFGFGCARRQWLHSSRHDRFSVRHMLHSQSSAAAAAAADVEPPAPLLLPPGARAADAMAAALLASLRIATCLGSALQHVKGKWRWGRARTQPRCLQKPSA
jgi:hypothetical protein